MEQLSGVGTIDLYVTDKRNRTCSNGSEMMIVSVVDKQGGESRIVAFGEAQKAFDERISILQAYTFCNILVSESQYSKGKEGKLTMSSNVIGCSSDDFAKPKTTTLVEALRGPPDSRVDLTGVVVSCGQPCVTGKRSLTLADASGEVEISTFKEAAAYESLQPGAVVHFKRAKLSTLNTFTVFDPPVRPVDEAVESLSSWYSGRKLAATPIEMASSMPYGSIFTIEGRVAFVSDLIALPNVMKRTIHVYDATAGIEVTLFAAASDETVEVGSCVRVQQARLTNWNGFSVATTKPIDRLDDNPAYPSAVDDCPFVSEKTERPVKWMDCKTISELETGARCSVIAALKRDGPETLTLMDASGSVAVRLHHRELCNDFASPTVVAIKNARRVDVGLMIYDDTPVDDAIENSMASAVREWLAAGA